MTHCNRFSYHSWCSTGRLGKSENCQPKPSNFYNYGHQLANLKHVLTNARHAPHVYPLSSPGEPCESRSPAPPDRGKRKGPVVAEAGSERRQVCWPQNSGAPNLHLNAAVPPWALSESFQTYTRNTMGDCLSIFKLYDFHLPKMVSFVISMCQQFPLPLFSILFIVEKYTSHKIYSLSHF